MVQEKSDSAAIKNHPPVSFCYHCGSEVDSDSLYAEEMGGVCRKFCCAGCMAIAQTIHGEGLEVFYARRIQAGSKPGAFSSATDIPENLLAYDDPVLLSRFTRPLASGSSDGFLETTLRLEKIRCAACVWLCEQHLKRIPGVLDVQINYVTQKAKIDFSPAKTSLARLLFEIERIGYEAWPFEPSLSFEKAKKEKRQLLTRLGVAILGMMQVMMYAWPSYTGAQDMSAEFELLLGWTSWALTVPVMVYSAGPIFSSAWHSIRLFPKSRMLGMDVPIALALSMAFFAGTVNIVMGFGQSYFDSITMFVAFILAARYLELLARQDAQGGAEALAKQLPVTCERLIRYPDSGEVQSVPLVKCQPGDVLRVSPGEVVPADGVLIAQESALDESLLTGEAKPVNKKVGDRVYAGTHNILNPLLMKIEAVGQSTRIAGIASLLDQALLAKPAMVSLAEKWAGYFVGFLLLAAFFSSAFWLLVDPSRAWTVLVAVLVASCPCALSLAVPTAMAAAQGAVTKLGLLIVRGHVMEGFVKATDLVVDKTGTLTMGQPELKEVLHIRSDFDRASALSLAAAMESGQRHPLALSLMRAAEAERLELPILLMPIANEMGRGLSSGFYRLGSAAWAGNCQVPVDTLIDKNGEYGNVYLSDAQGLIAKFVFLDTPRAGARDLLNAAKDRNISVHLISGDDLRTVAWWATYFGIENYRGDCTPEDKYDYIEQLQKKDRFVWAIGDGVNDAPLLARANISVAVGAGAPLASAGADAILTAVSLLPLAKALLLADKTQLVIKENLIWALIYNLVAIPVAMMGWVNPWVAGIGMSISSLAVTLNAWRLRKA